MDDVNAPPRAVQQATPPRSQLRFTRLLLLALIWMAFARLIWQIDDKSLWLDEAFSVLRAQLPWLDLLVGRIVVTDGLDRVPTTDQHPFAYFLLLGLWTRLVGDAPFLLRVPSALSGTLMVPALWVFGHFFARREVLPRSTGHWAALLAAASPFYLWYGQETRMYMLWALLAVLSTYCLLRWMDSLLQPNRWRWGAGYALSVAFFLTVHFYSVLLVPVHVLFLLQHLWRRRPRLSLVLAAALIAGALAVAAYAAYGLITTPSAGSNFVAVNLPLLLPDALNAFSLGLSVDLAQVWGLDLLFAVVAAIGLICCVRPFVRFLHWGWILPAFIFAPILLIAGASLFRAVYMNARHVSLISGAFLVAVAGGLAWLWTWRAWAGYGAAVLLLAGMGYSSVNYYANPLYSKGEMAEMGRHPQREIHPGDLMLLNPPEQRPLYEYYLPVDLAEETDHLTWMGAPFWHVSRAETERLLDDLRQQHRRIWLVVGDPDTWVDDWLQANAFQIREAGWNSPISWLQLKLYLPRSPVLETAPALPEEAQIHATFGERIQLYGYQTGEPVQEESVTPVTLYWQATQPIEERYKYLLQLVDRKGEVLAATEREPYDGYWPTPWWAPGTMVVEHTDILVPAGMADLQLHLQWYDAETLEMLPVTQDGAASVGENGTTLILPFSP